MDSLDINSVDSLPGLLVMLMKSLVVMPEIALLVGTLIVLMVSLFAGRNSENVTYTLSLVTLIGMVFLFLRGIDRPDVVLFEGMYVHDGLAKLIKVLICITVAAIFVYARPYLLSIKNSRPEFYVLGLFATLGMLVMASAQNFITIYLGLELLSLCLYALVAYIRDSNDAPEAAIKYFVLGAITGSLSLTEISAYLQSADGLNIGLIFALTFIVVGVAFKFGAVPFHMWVPDVYQGAPTAVTIFIATAPKLAAFVMAIRLLSYGMQELVDDWQQMLMILAVLSLVFGNLIAIAQSHIKRMLAYSTISHVGFVLLGFLSGESFGYAAALFYTVIYVLMAAGAFGVLLLLSKHNRSDIDELSDLKGLNQSHPRLALIMLLVMFAMAGMPLTVGFYAKLYVLQSLVYNDFIWLALLAVIMSIVGAFYYLRVIKYIYFDDLEVRLGTHNNAWLANAVLSINGLLIIGLFIFPNYLLNYCVSVFP
jgi:NADH-quinone oxidoreductase subunit N